MALTPKAAKAAALRADRNQPKLNLTADDKHLAVRVLRDLSVDQPDYAAATARLMTQYNWVCGSYWLRNSLRDWATSKVFGDASAAARKLEHRSKVAQQPPAAQALPMPPILFRLREVEDRANAFSHLENSWMDSLFAEVPPTEPPMGFAMPAFTATQSVAAAKFFRSKQLQIWKITSVSGGCTSQCQCFGVQPLLWHPCITKT